MKRVRCDALQQHLTKETNLLLTIYHTNKASQEH